MEAMMTELGLQVQNIVALATGVLNVMPLWLALGVHFIPTMVALYTRNLFAVLLTLIMNIVCLALVAPGASAESGAPLATTAFAASLIFALFGLRERLLWQNLSGLETRVGVLDEQTLGFLKALEEARKAFEDTR